MEDSLGTHTYKVLKWALSTNKHRKSNIVERQYLVILRKKIPRLRDRKETF